MSFFETYLRFRACATLDADLTRELSEIEGEKAQIAERFASCLSFGTAGLRGIIGAGTSRMNVYTVGRATQGVFDVIDPQRKGARAVFVVGYDTRIKSDLFARRTAEVLCARGAKVYLAEEPIPVPLVSFVVRKLSADAGVCITASHNPAVYNGYKVFDSTGGQLLEDAAQAVSRAADAHDYFEELPAKMGGEICPIPSAVFEAYFKKLQEDHPSQNREKSALRVVYTPLFGTGLRFVPRALREAGFEDVELVREEACHDGTFPTCQKPNPEERSALTLALKQSEESGADIFLATDPDCDRVGVGVRTNDGYRCLTGNETGLLLLDFLLRRSKAAGKLSPRTFVCTTIVSAEMADAISADWGIELKRVLTGFKYIGEQIARLEREGRLSDFLFGFEESYGCLASTQVRDKDACEACVLICQMAEECRRAGKTLLHRLGELEKKYGIFVNQLKNYEFSGLSAKEDMSRFMASLRASSPEKIAGSAVVAVEDYLSLRRRSAAGESVIDLPRADVLSFEMENGTRLMVRPSGTEPKVKLYLFAHDSVFEKAEEKLMNLCAFCDTLFE